MPPKDRIFILTILLIMLSAVIISGCTTTNTTTSPAASAPATGGNTPAGTPKVSTSGQTMTISGSQSGQVTMTMAKGLYLVSIKSKDGSVSMSTPMMGTDVDLISYDSASLGSSGWYEQQAVHSWSKAGDGSFKITASTPYIIEWSKLPTGAASVSPPQTYSGKGQKVVGPVKLTSGTATFKMSCPDAKSAGFAVVIFNTNEGIASASVGNNADSGSVQNSYSSTKTVNIATAGDYLVQVTANSDANWEVTVSQ
jgi:hypothetical protein